MSLAQPGQQGPHSTAIKRKRDTGIPRNAEAPPKLNARHNLHTCKRARWSNSRRTIKSKHNNSDEFVVTRNVQTDHDKLKTHVDKCKRSKAKSVDKQQPLYFREETGDNAVAISRFQSSFKPFIASSVVLMTLIFGAAVFYPAISVTLLSVVTGIAVIASFRCHLVDLDNQDRARWLFGWSWVAMAFFTGCVSIFSCPPDANVDRLGIAVLSVEWIICFVFLAISGMPGPCRMVSMLVHGISVFALPCGWTADDPASSATSLVGGMILGELIGRIWVHHDEKANAVDKPATNRPSQPSPNPFIAFSAICALLEHALGVTPPALAGPFIRTGAQLVMCAGLLSLRGRAQMLFGWAWGVVVAYNLAACVAFSQQWYVVSHQLATVVALGWAIVWLVTFIHLHVTRAPWIARWAMLWIICALIQHTYPPSWTRRISLALVATLPVGEVIGFVCRHVHVLSNRISLVCYAFRDTAKEQAYSAKQFEESYPVVLAGCTIEIVLNIFVVASCKELSRFIFIPCGFWLGVIALRLYTKYTIAHLEKPAFFGFRMVIMKLLIHLGWIVATWHTSMTFPPAVIFCYAVGVIVFIIFGKLAGILERHRQAMNFFILITFLLSPPLSSLGEVATFWLYSIAFLVAELVAYTLDHRRRAKHWEADSLRHKVHSMEARLKLAMDTTLSAACVFDQHMNFDYANPAMAAMFGYTPNQLLRKHVSILMAPAMAECYDDFVRKFLQTDVDSDTDTESLEIEGKHKDGHALDLRIVLNTSPDQLCFVASFVDITAEKKHQKIERDMKLAIDTALSPIAMANSEMTVTYVNQAVFTIFGYTEKELVGQKIDILLDGVTRADQYARVAAFQKTREDQAIRIVGREVECKHKDGHTLYLRLSLDVADDGKLFVTSFQDMSAELAQRESKRKHERDALLRSLYTSTPGAIAYEVSNPGSDERIEWVAGATKTLLGYTHEEWRSIRPFETVVTDASKPAVTQAISAIRTGKPVPVIEFEGTHRDGHAVWLRIDKASRRLPSNNELVVLHDVTAEMCLREANAAMATFQNVPGFILVTITTDMASHMRVDGDVVGVTGYTEEEFVALDPVRDFLSPEADRTQVVSLFESIVNSNQSFVEVNIPYLHKDGHTIWLRARQRSRAIGSERNVKPQVLVVFSDVTATVVAQREVLAVRDAFMRRIKFIPAMVYEMVADDTTGTRRFVYVNSQSTSIYGLTPAEMTNSCKWRALLHPEDSHSYDQSIRESQANMKKWDLEFRVVVKGRTKYLHGRAMPRREGGTVVWTGVLQDVTINHNLRAMTKNVDIQKAIAKRFKVACAFLSHEIRNQLYPQSVVLDEMKDQETRWEEEINMILHSNATVTAILNRVLDLAKWESGEFPIEASFFPVIRLFKHIASYAQAKGAIVEGLASVGAKRHIKADEYVLKQAATNLVSNAVKFSNGRAVRIVFRFQKTSAKEGEIVLIVIDKGRGMTREQLVKVMVPFGQIRKAGEARSGTGLGLPLTKAMVEYGHKGTLSLESDGLGKGTTAIMRVPALWKDRREDPRQRPDLLWWVAPHPDVTADILIVDDVKVNRMVTICAAKKLGLTYHEAADGKEAVERLLSNTYSIVFMDRQMPVMNGDDATEKARANGYTLPIVMTSGDTFESSEKTALKRRGITAFLNKMAVPGTRHAMKKLKEIKEQSLF